MGKVQVIYDDLNESSNELERMQAYNSNLLKNLNNLIDILNNIGDSHLDENDNNCFSDIIVNDLEVDLNDRFTSWGRDYLDYLYNGCRSVVDSFTVAEDGVTMDSTSFDNAVSSITGVTGGNYSMDDVDFYKNR